MAFKRKLILNVIMFAILFSFALQISMFSVSVSSGKNVSGVVYASSGVPVSGAMVVAVGTDGYGSAITNLNGQYVITEGLTSGTYTVRVTKEGYLYGEKENVVVAVGSETSGVNVYLNLSGGVSGRITDAISGYPIPEIAVVVMPSSGGGIYIGTGFSDVAGNYQVAMNLATGSYNVSVILPKAYAGKTVGPISVTAGSVTTGVNLALSRSGIISGRITTPTGDPLANITVTAFSLGYAYSGYDETNATGHYRIDSGLGTGTYTIMAVSGFNINQTSVSVTAGVESPNNDLQLDVTPPPPSGIIMGKVTDTNSAPIAGAHVSAEGDTMMSSGDAITDGDGNYVMSEGLATDTYNVTASAHGYQSQSTTNVNVVEYQITPNVNFQLIKIPPAQSGRISGTVTGDPNPIPEFQYPIAVMLVVTLLAVAIAKSSGRRPTTPKRVKVPN